MVLPIVGGLVALGYFLTKGEKNPRVEEVKRTSVEKTEIPNGKNIYNSNKYEEVNREILERSINNYKEAEEPARTGMLPPLYNTYSVVGNKIVNGDMGLMREQGSEIDRKIKIEDVKKGKERDINNRPMFNNDKYYIEIGQTRDITRDNENDIDKNISLLTGLEIDMTHNNMVPFFGSNIKQNVEKFTNQSILDLHTGNTSTFQHKKEVANMFDAQPENIYGTPIITNQISTDRFIPSRFRQNEKAMQEDRIAAPIAGTFENNIRPGYKDINELRVGNRLQQTYEGRTLAGQMGSVRGAQSEFAKHRPDTYYEKGMDHLFKGPGEFIAKKADEDYTTGFKDTGRSEYNQEYYGGVSTSDLLKNKQRYKLADGETQNEDSVVQIPKRQNFEHDYSRNVSGFKMVNDFGKSGMVSYETERATTGEKTHLISATKTENGNRVRFRDEARPTIKQTTLIHDNSGNIKTTFDKGYITAYETGIIGMEAKSTHKESTLINNYKGITSKEQGMGYLVNKYDAKTTGKEIISSNSDYTGIAGKDIETTSRENYRNAEIRDYKEQVIKRDRMAGEQNFQISSGKDSYGDIKEKESLLIKEREDDREKLNVYTQQNVPSKNIIGYVSKPRFDNEDVDKAFVNRLEPSLVVNQHTQNPYSIYGK
jgi:hypothetical protein